MLGPLRFAPIFMERVWGGSKMAAYVPGFKPGSAPIGEAWLISDHPSAVSVVEEGKHRGKTLRDLLTENAEAILGRSAKLTPHGRFPLLLKILDSGAPLSVQVHPDDACAERLGEPDVGKTEMWHVIDADPGSELVCGLDPALDAQGFRSASSSVAMH
jgi:mannose-6-phosphate isomerase